MCFRFGSTHYYWLSLRQLLIVLAITLAPFSVAAAATPRLTVDNYDDMTKDRAILIRFVIDPEMCQKCVETNEAWKQLAKEWEDHPIGFVVPDEVYCDSSQPEIADICEWFEVTGYPSVYYGNPQSPEIYKGKLDVESLQEFAKENISKLPCSITNLDVCLPKVRRLVAQLQKKTVEELEEMEKAVLKQVEEEQSRFDKAALKLQQQYEDLANNFNTKIDKIRDDSGFKWIQQLLNDMEEEQKATEQEEEGEEEEVKTDEF